MVANTKRKSFFVVTLLFLSLILGLVFFIRRWGFDNKEDETEETSGTKIVKELEKDRDLIEDEDLQSVLGEESGELAEESSDTNLPSKSSGSSNDDPCIGDIEPSGPEKNDTQDDLGEQKFELASFHETALNKIPVGTVRSLSVNIRQGEDVKLIDFTKYEQGYIVFKWGSGSFEYGLSDKRNVPSLYEVEVSDELNEFSDTKVSELIPFEEQRLVFIRPLGNMNLLSVDIISPQQGTTGGFFAQANHNSGAKYSSLNIIPREVWSGDPDINDPDRLVWDPVYYKVNKFVIHHTATPNDRDPIEDIRAVYLYHRYSIPWYGGTGFGDIGYNYLIDRYGNIYEGKLGGEEAKGYHAGAANANSIGISVLGTYTSVAPSQAAQNALVRLMAEKGAFYNFDPVWHGTVFGHRDFMATACPGNAFYPLLPNLSSSARSYKYSNFGFIITAEQQIQNDINNSDYKAGKLALIWYSPSDIAIPAWSGIDSYLNYNNTTTLTVTDTSTPYEGVSDRIRTLYLTYSLNGEVRDVGLIHRGQIP